MSTVCAALPNEQETRRNYSPHLDRLFERNSLHQNRGISILVMTKYGNRELSQESSLILVALSNLEKLH